jgi:hypothetical protein
LRPARSDFYLISFVMSLLHVWDAGSGEYCGSQSALDLVLAYVSPKWAKIANSIKRLGCGLGDRVWFPRRAIIFVSIYLNRPLCPPSSYTMGIGGTVSEGKGAEAWR